MVEKTLFLVCLQQYEDEHGPMALEMVKELAENDPTKWKEIEEVSIEALKKRIELWNSIEKIIVGKKVLV